MDAWGDIHKCGPVKIRDLQNAGNILQEQETENCRPCKTQAAIGVEMEQEIETCPACRQDQSLTNFELSKTQNAFAIRNLLPRKLDPPDTLNEVAVATLALTDDHVLGKVNIAWVRRCRDTEPCDTQESLERRIVFLINLLFIWRPYMGVGIPDGLEPHMFICSTQSPLVSFECIEWHATDRVRRQFGMQQLPPGPAFNLGRDHCKRLTGAQNHYWGQIYSQWVNRWTFDRYNTLQLGEEIIDFHPLPVYYDWYTQQYGIHLRLSDRVPGGEIGADEPQQQQEEPAGPHQGVPPHEQQEQVPAYEHHYQVQAHEHQL
ncbi:hypothetical protein Ahy_B09g099508 [Arachis hypogaea]|uniref:Aminotransferase-like plant mobile domain-containing protein n=1 Tax=Arachis hypogaea TaxID=3818 RepID=A0A444XTX6_ARAHY|nr:hypothetical protein Ahy_B09g099508 [Arachis hypogaea]